MSKMTGRDLNNGTLMAAGSSMVAFGPSSQGTMASLAPSYYLPALTGETETKAR